MENSKNILKGKEWQKYLKDNNFLTRKQENIYFSTHKHTPIYKIGEYFFTIASTGILGGYKNISSLKRLIK